MMTRPEHDRPSATATYLRDPAERDRPWPGEFHEIEITGRRGVRRARVHVRRTPGPPGAPAAVFVHGLGGSATNWTDLATGVSGGYEGIAIDLPGYGRSDPAPDRDYSVEAFTRWVVATIDKVVGPGVPVHLVGNSMGGLIVIAVAARRPDLVATLTLISPAVPGFDAPVEADPRMVLLAAPVIGPRLQRRFGLGDARDRAMMTIDLCFADPSRVPEFRIEQAALEVKERAGFPWAIPVFTGSLRSIAGLHLHRRPSNPWRRAASLRMPTLIIWGDRDRLIPVRRAARLQSVIGDSRLVVFEGVGHTAQLEVPSRTAEAFWSLAEQHAAAHQPAGITAATHNAAAHSEVRDGSTAQG